MPGWRPAFYGASAAVFVPATAPGGSTQTGSGVAHLRNGAAGLKVFDFAVAVGDYSTAWNVLDQMEGPLRRQMEREALKSAHSYREGHGALRGREYARAYDDFESAFRHRIISDRDNIILVLLRALLKVDANSAQAATFAHWTLAHDSSALASCVQSLLIVRIPPAMNCALSKRPSGIFTFRRMASSPGGVRVGLRSGSGRLAFC